MSKFVTKWVTRIWAPFIIIWWVADDSPFDGNPKLHWMLLFLWLRLVSFQFLLVWRRLSPKTVSAQRCEFNLKVFPPVLLINRYVIGQFCNFFCWIITWNRSIFAIFLWKHWKINLVHSPISMNILEKTHSTLVHFLNEPLFHLQVFQLLLRVFVEGNLLNGGRVCLDFFFAEIRDSWTGLAMIHEL